MIEPTGPALEPRLSILVSHPTQFEGPLYPKIARMGKLDLEVYFWRTDRTTELLIDGEVGLKPQWDNIPLIEGYNHHLLPAGIRECWQFILREVLVPSERRVLLVNGWYGRAALLALLAGVLKSVPIILRLDTVDLYPVSWIRSARRWAISSVLYRIPKAFMVTSTLTKQHLLRRGVKEEAIFFFPYAVDNTLLAESAASEYPHRADLRRDLGIAPDLAVIMAALKFISREGVWDLVRAYAELADWHQSTVLLLVGDGPLRDDLEAFIQKRPRMNVILPGWVPYSRLIQLYALSDLFVHPGIEEPWGCSIQEAAACRLPIVSSDLVGATYDLVWSGENGLVYPGGDISVLRDTLASMLEKRSYWSEMGEKSWEIVQDWGHDRAMAEIERAVDYVLSSKMP